MEVKILLYKLLILMFIMKNLMSNLIFVLINHNKNGLLNLEKQNFGKS